MNAPQSDFQNTYAVRDIDGTLDRLDNWKRWAKDKPQYRVTKSLEGKYKSPQHWHPPEPKIFVDILDAIKVERAIIDLPKPYKQLIIYKYIMPFLSFDGFCRKAAIRPDQYDVFERRAIDMIVNRLRRAELFTQDVALKKYLC